jgi:hypothetical protein
MSSSAERPAHPTDQVITAYTIATRGGVKTRESAFDIAVDVYLNEFLRRIAPPPPALWRTSSLNRL